MAVVVTVGEAEAGSAVVTLSLRLCCPLLCRLHPASSFLQATALQHQRPRTGAVTTTLFTALTLPHQDILQQRALVPRVRRKRPLP